MSKSIPVAHKSPTKSSAGTASQKSTSGTQQRAASVKAKSATKPITNTVKVKASKSPAKATKKKNTPRSGKSQLSGKEIMLNLHNEHKYIAKLLDLFAEEIQQFNLSALPDYNILYDVVTYLHNVSDVTHHHREDIIFKKLSEIDQDFRQESEALILKHETLAQKTASLRDALKALCKGQPIDSIENFQFRCEDFLKLQRTHLDIEESKIFPRIVERFNDEDWAAILPSIQPQHDPVFGETVERPYRHLYKHLTERMERAAEEFTLAEFIGLGTFIETLGAISTGTSKISGTLRSHGRKAMKNDVVAFRRLFRSRSMKPGDYASVTLDCMLNNFDTWAECMREVGIVLRQTRSQVAEPYQARTRLYNAVRDQDKAAAKVN